VRVYAPLTNIAAGPTTNFPDNLPVEPVTEQERDEVTKFGVRPVLPVSGDCVIVHDVSTGMNPVPVRVTEVPATDPSAGEPLMGVTVTNAVTVNAVPVETSPELPVT
jgi:hypothetical protein